MPDENVTTTEEPQTEYNSNSTAEVKSATTAVKLLTSDENTITVGGYGIVWGGLDLTGEGFAKGVTDLSLDTIPAKPVFYDHTLTGVKNALGETVTEREDDFGLWVEAQLNRNREYVEHVEQLVKAGALGWSSGAVAHLVERDGPVIKRWPVYEYSLTPTPAEPRTLGVDIIKSLAEHYPELKAFLPEATGEVAADAGAEDAEPVNHKTITEEPDEDTIMTEEVKNTEEVKAPVVDIDALIAGLKPVVTDAAKSAATEAVEAALKAQPADNGGYYIPDGENTVNATKRAPAELKYGRGDTETKSIAAWIRTGDGGTAWGGFKLYGGSLDMAAMYAAKASNDTSMNIGTSADGGYVVPTGHFGQIIARRDELMLAQKLGVRRIPGQGTTVNVPIDSEPDGEFVSTSEQVDDHSNTYDRDAPNLWQKAFTLVKYTKKVELTDELMDDEDSNLLAFLADFIGRGMAKTHNSLLLTEVASNGASFKTFASASAIAAGEPQDILGNDDLSAYMDAPTGIAWVGRSSTYWDIASITGNPFLYAPTPAGGTRELLGYPFYYSQKAAAIGASAKSLYFGNWYYVGYRDPKGLTLLRDPYTVDGMLVLKYAFRTVYGVLQAEAIGYGVHPSA